MVALCLGCCIGLCGVACQSAALRKELITAKERLEVQESTIEAFQKQLQQATTAASEAVDRRATDAQQHSTAIAALTAQLSQHQSLTATKEAAWTAAKADVDDQLRRSLEDVDNLQQSVGQLSAQLRESRQAQAALEQELAPLKAQGDVREAYAKLQRAFERLQTDCRYDC